jgi:unsaturated rhamnogalacturonyl hydrolase
MSPKKAVGLMLGLTSSLLAAPGLVGCGQSSPNPSGGTGGTGATGGSAMAGTGGSKPTTGGAPGSGGSGGTGGTGGTGQAGMGTGGTAAVGAAGSGGSTSSGGAGGSSGTNAIGGTAGLPMGAGGMPIGGASGSTGAAAGAGGSAAGAGGSAGAMPGGCVAVDDFTNWPSGKGPADIGKLVVSDFKTHESDTYGGAGYALAFAWYGALKYTVTTGDTTNNMQLITAFEPYASGMTTVPNDASSTIDQRAFGVLPLEIYIEDMDARDKTLGLARADQQWVGADSNGVPTDARYWSDDMYMITGLQVQAYRATKDTTYLNRSAALMIDYISKLQQSDGLFWHTQQSKAYWGRANGWVLSGMTELLLELPTGSVRDSIMAAYQKQIDGLLPLQISGGNDDGCWRQVVDVSSANAETSCTAMFTFALTNGMRNGWLTDPKYSAAARKGWLALAAKTSSGGKLADVCPGTGQADAGSLASQQQFYDSIALVTGDLHGEAPELWSANSLLTTDCHGVR